MKLNMKEIIRDIYKEEIYKENGHVYTLKDVFIFSLLKADLGKMDKKEDYQRYELAVKIRNSEEEINFSSSELSLLLECVHQCTPLEVYGFICDLVREKEKLNDERI